jgi:lipopolysaccharide/colanic/teichoic acid biosynthesis glycosyltransferase
VRPGITGRLALDVRYVDERNLALDLRILARTVLAVVRREGISADGHPTMPELGADGADK